jgi:hypothetical protein
VSVICSRARINGWLPMKIPCQQNQKQIRSKTSK